MIDVTNIEGQMRASSVRRLPRWSSSIRNNASPSCAAGCRQERG